MAGSWKHFTDSSGRFTGSWLLENGGDVVEALEEAYGMVWYLATALADSGQAGVAFTPPLLVEEARQHYKDGLQASPGFTEAAKRQNINWDGAWGDVRAHTDEESD